MEKIGLYVNTEKVNDMDYIKKIIQYLLEKKKTVITCENISQFSNQKGLVIDRKKTFQETDLLVVLGGDGTILEATSRLKNLQIPIMGVNYGKLGFLAEIEGQDIFDAFEKVFQGEYAIEKRMMLDMQLEGQTQVYSALNDVVIGRGTNTRLVDIEVNANGSQVESYRADGLILSTPTGSTAYSLSAGGPIIDPSNDNILMATPICPHSLHSRSIILDANKEIEVRLVSENSPGVVAVDGQKFISIKGNEVIRIQKSKRQCQLIKFVDSNFFQTLRRKLSTRV